MAEENENRDAAEISAETFSIPDSSRRVELDAETLANMNRLVLVLERMRMGEYLALFSQPRKILSANFMAGLARGLGFGLGMTVLLGLSLWLLGRMVDIPLIGAYVAKIVTIVQQEINGVGNPPPKF